MAYQLYTSSEFDKQFRKLDRSVQKTIDKWIRVHLMNTEDPYVSGPDADGWYTFSFTFGEMTDPRFGFRLELACYSTELGKFQPKDYIDIKDLEYKGEKLTIEAADEDNEYQSNQGVWNASNTDHTLPTLTIIKTN